MDTCETCDSASSRLRRYRGVGPLEDDACYQYRVDNRGAQRPDHLIERAARRHSRRHSVNFGADLSDNNEDTALTIAAYIGQSSSTLVECSCGCGRMQDCYSGESGLSKYCRDLAWARSRG